MWQDDEPNEIELANVPAWILELLDEPQQDALPVVRGREQGWRGNTEVGEGNRNSSMTSYVGLLIQQGGTVQSIYDKANRANQRYCRPPIEDDEMRRLSDLPINRWTTPEARQIGLIRPIEYYQTQKFRATQFSKKFSNEVSFIQDQNVWGEQNESYLLLFY